MATNRLEAIFTAIEDICLRDITELLENGANVNIVNEQGDTPLHFAIKLSHRHYGIYGIVEKLIQHDADVNALNKKGETPLDVSLLAT